MRDAVRKELVSIALRFSSDAPSVDEAALRSRYSALEAWPADAQLGLYILAWALGSGFALKGFKDAVNALIPDFARAASAVELKGDSSFITIASIARRALRNAHVVVECALDPDLLYSPLNLHSCRNLEGCGPITATCYNAQRSFR